MRKRERCWIAELDGERVGSVFVVDERPRRVAKLRLLLVEPRARGRGLGSGWSRSASPSRARRATRKLVLWTQSNLAAARAIYTTLGFELSEKRAARQFGVPAGRRILGS